MKQKITFPTLVANLAISSGKSKKQCEDFLRELFNVIEETLTQDEPVKIKGLGTFKLIEVDSRKSVDVNTGEEIEIPGHKRISFIPAKELAEKVNEPFDMFESVEAPEEEVAEAPNNSYNLEENLEQGAEAEAKAEEEITEAEVENSFEEEVNINEDNEIAQAYEKAYEQAASDEDYVYEEATPKKRFRFMWGFLTGLVCMLLIAAAGLIFFGDKLTALVENLPFKQVTVSKVIEDEKEDKSDVTIADTLKIESEKVESGKETEYAEVEKTVPTAPSDKVVTDTISRTRYLSTMAQQHYGNFNLWPYIYIENQAKLGHPDHIKPGTPVVIPDLKKYGVNPNNPENIKEAKKKGVEIYAKFQ